MKVTFEGALMVGEDVEELTWENGTLGGSARAVRGAEEVIEANDGTPVGPHPLRTLTAEEHLASADSFSALMKRHLFAPGVVVQGLPERQHEAGRIY